MFNIEKLVNYGIQFYDMLKLCVGNHLNIKR